MKKTICLAAYLLSLVMVVTGCTSAKNNDSAKQETKSDVTQEQDREENSSVSGTAVSTDEPLSGKHHAKIKIKKYGTIKVELDADTAPITVTNFVKLANEGFYNGLTFHRIISGFMIQGGDPEGNGTGGSKDTIRGEFSANGVENNLSHERGVLSMARSSDYDSASSQFFIVHQDADYLDGQYAAFGKVTKGMKIVDKICTDAKVEDNNGTVLAENQPVIESIVVTD